MGYTFALIQDDSMLNSHVITFIDQWNETHGDDKHITLLTSPDMRDEPGVDGWLLNVSLDNGWFEWLHSNLRLHPDMTVCFFIEPKELVLFSYIRQLEDDFPFASIGTILKPTQYANVKRFFDATLTKKKLPTFDDSALDNFDFDIDDE